MPDRMRKAVETVLDAWNSGDVDRLDEVCTPSCVFHTPPVPRHGPRRREGVHPGVPHRTARFRDRAGRGHRVGRDHLSPVPLQRHPHRVQPADPRRTRWALVRDERLLDGPLAGRQSRGGLALPALALRVAARRKAASQSRSARVRRGVHRGTGAAGRAQRSGTKVGVQARSCHGSEFVGGFAWAESGSIRPVAQHGCVRVGDRQDASEQRDLLAASGRGVAGAVEVLVVGADRGLRRR